MRKHFFFAYAALIGLGLYGPLLEILRKNNNIQELYGFGGIDFLYIFLGGFLLPVIISSLIARKFITVFWILMATTFFISGLGLAYKLVILGAVLLFSLAVVKNHTSFISFIMWASLFVLPDVGYKTYFLMREHLNLGVSKVELPATQKLPNAPSNIFFFLLDGTDLTSSYLDEEGYPREDLLPNLHTLLKQDFHWYPKTYSNTPQTFMSIPTMMTGTFGYQQAKEKFAQGDDLLSQISRDYDVNAFFYLNFYREFCLDHRTSCYPFNSQATFHREMGSLILAEMYLHRLSWGAFPLPFKLGVEFKPSTEPYTFAEFVERFKSSKQINTFNYLHIIRRSLHGLIQFDQELGELVSYLKEKNLYANSMIVMSADHGYDETQSGRKYGQDSKFTARVFRIPFAVKPPGIGRNHLSSIRAQTVDIKPTMLTFIYGPQPGSLVGVTELERVHPILCNKEKVSAFIDEVNVEECKKESP